jgi:hypothetical protein
MKKLIILTSSLLILVSLTGSAHAYQLPRCYYPATGKRYIPTEIHKTNSGYSCYVNVGGKLKSMGVATLEEPTGIKGYENDKVLTSIGLLTIKKVNDNIYGTGFCLMDRDICYPLQSDYGRYLLANGTIQ